MPVAKGFYAILPAFPRILPTRQLKKSPLARNRLKRRACCAGADSSRGFRAHERRKTALHEESPEVLVASALLAIPHELHEFHEDRLCPLR
jgi:hypothetical protein